MLRLLLLLRYALSRFIQITAQLPISVLDAVLPVQYTVLATVAMTMLVRPVPAPSSRTVAPLNVSGSARMKSASSTAPRHT